MNILKKLFVQGRWDIAFSMNGGEDFNFIKSTSNRWFADPFCYEKEGRHYIFCEVMQGEKGKGAIGVFAIDDENPCCKVVIEEPFHMSYPNVFEISGTVYMIPETHQAKQVRLYRAVAFPYEWKLCKVLLDGVDVADSTFMHFGESDYLLTYDVSNAEGRLLCYWFDRNQVEVGSLLFECDDAESQERPGGNCIYDKDGTVVRVVQNCQDRYGAGLIYKKVVSVSVSGIEEKTVFEIKPNDIVAGSKYSGVHTYNSIGDMAVYDLAKEALTPSKPFLHFRRMVNRIRNNQ